MKAYALSRYGPPENLGIQELDKPTPKDHEILIRVRSVSINDWDWGIVRGRPIIYRLYLGILKPRILIPGVDVAGQVEAVGQNVTKFQPGDEVYGDLSASGFGGFAEFVCADEGAVVAKSPGMTFDQAAAIPHAAMLAVQGLCDVGGIQRGQRVLINGAGGGVGTLGVQIAKLYGAEVTGVDSSDKLDMLHKVGFDKVIDYRRKDFTKSEEKYDLILDVRTTRSPFDFLRVLNPQGAYVTVGGTVPRIIQTFLLGRLIWMITKKSVRIVALKPNKNLARMNELFDAGELHPVLDGPYGFEELPHALNHFGVATHKGKVIVRISEP